MITLTLLHPIHAIPVQRWTFSEESPVIRIGRSTDNDVVLYSAVVSRHHVEIRRVGSSWEIASLGTNGTYLDGKRINQVPVVDGVTIRLARSGPNIQINLGDSGALNTDGEPTLGQSLKLTKVGDAPTGPLMDTVTHSHADTFGAEVSPEPSTGLESLLTTTSSSTLVTPVTQRSADGGASACQHLRAMPEMRFCPDCGKLLQVDGS